MKAILFISVTLATASSGVADQAIWSGKLVNGWEDWSWAKVNKAGPTMNVIAKDWQGVYFHHASQKSSFAAFAFAINGGSKGGQHLELRATVNKSPLKEAYLPPLKPGWQTISVPLKHLGLTGEAFDGVWIQAQKACSFEMKNVKLTGK
jgi:hypothetical protein